MSDSQPEEHTDPAEPFTKEDFVGYSHADVEASLAAMKSLGQKAQQAAEVVDEKYVPAIKALPGLIPKSLVIGTLYGAGPMKLSSLGLQAEPIDVDLLKAKWLQHATVEISIPQLSEQAKKTLFGDWVLDPDPKPVEDNLFESSVEPDEFDEIPVEPTVRADEEEPWATLYGAKFVWTMLPADGQFSQPYRGVVGRMPMNHANLIIKLLSKVNYDWAQEQSASLSIQDYSGGYHSLPQIESIAYRVVMDEEHVGHSSQHPVTLSMPASSAYRVEKWMDDMIPAHPPMNTYKPYDGEPF